MHRCHKSNQSLLTQHVARLFVLDPNDSAKESALSRQRQRYGRVVNVLTVVASGDGDEGVGGQVTTRPILKPTTPATLPHDDGHDQGPGQDAASETHHIVMMSDARTALLDSFRGTVPAILWWGKKAVCSSLRLSTPRYRQPRQLNIPQFTKLSLLHEELGGVIHGECTTGSVAGNQKVVGGKVTPASTSQRKACERAKVVTLIERLDQRTKRPERTHTACVRAEPAPPQTNNTT